MVWIVKNEQFWFFGHFLPSEPKNGPPKSPKIGPNKKIWILNVPGSWYKCLNIIFEEFRLFLTQPVIDSSTVEWGTLLNIWNSSAIAQWSGLPKMSQNQILSENMSWASIYSSQVVEFHFEWKIYFFYCHQISKFGAVLPCWLQKNLAFSSQYSLSQPNRQKT